MAVTVNGSGGSMAKTLVNKDGATLGALEKAGAGKARVSGGLGSAVKNKVVEGVSFSSDNGLNQTGTFAPEQKTVTPTKEQQTVTPTAGKFLSSVTVKPISGSHIEMPNILENTKNIGVFDKIVKAYSTGGYIASTRDGRIFKFDEDFNKVWEVKVLDEIVAISESLVRTARADSKRESFVICSDSKGNVAGIDSDGNLNMTLTAQNAINVVEIASYDNKIILGGSDGSVVLLFYDFDNIDKFTEIKSTNNTSPIIGSYSGCMLGDIIFGNLCTLDGNLLSISGKGVYRTKYIDSPLKVYASLLPYSGRLKRLYNMQDQYLKYYCCDDKGMLYYKSPLDNEAKSIQFDSPIIALACDIPNCGVWVLTSNNDIKYLDCNNEVSHVMHGSTTIRTIFYGRDFKSLWICYANGNVEQYKNYYGLIFNKDSNGSYIKANVENKFSNVVIRYVGGQTIRRTRKMSYFGIWGIDDEDNVYVYTTSGGVVKRYDEKLETLQVTYPVDCTESWLDKSNKTLYRKDSSYNYHIHCYDANGSEIYSLYISTSYLRCVTNTHDRRIIYVLGQYSGYTATIYMSDGANTLCTYKAGDIYGVFGSLVTVKNGRSRYYIAHSNGSSRSYVECFDVDNNLERIFEAYFAINAPSNYRYVYELYAPNDYLFLVEEFKEDSAQSGSKKLYRLNPDSGEIIWTQSFNLSDLSFNGLDLKNTQLRIDKYGNVLYGNALLDINTGELLAVGVDNSKFVNSRGNKIQVYQHSDSYSKNYGIEEIYENYTLYDSYLVEREMK